MPIWSKVTGAFIMPASNMPAFGALREIACRWHLHGKERPQLSQGSTQKVNETIASQQNSSITDKNNAFAAEISAAAP
ncbi:hypothetical protein ACRQ1B_01005 [Rhizobium panacihumi]|uniref:hypothetical protein n=1 Tax=Rhizobium panacihumi TaxID=2008450 RepID=UPI003D79852C